MSFIFSFSSLTISRWVWWCLNLFCLGFSEVPKDVNFFFYWVCIFCPYVFRLFSAAYSFFRAFGTAMSECWWLFWRADIQTSPRTHRDTHIYTDPSSAGLLLKCLQQWDGARLISGTGAQSTWLPQEFSRVGVTDPSPWALVMRSVDTSAAVQVREFAGKLPHAACSTLCIHTPVPPVPPSSQNSEWQLWMKKLKLVLLLQGMLERRRRMGERQVRTVKQDSTPKNSLLTPF